jgi:hypothetical protein
MDSGAGGIHQLQEAGHESGFVDVSSRKSARVNQTEDLSEEGNLQLAQSFANPTTHRFGPRPR